ncbi:Chymotrypsin-like protein [Daphnia magna]|uniref:Chymotrypsin-like protein n=1 Tax=Daphnia magna TaxID=35525 RepID=A0A164XNL3_9CRUS|nr:Chymotrypsin-like protein [Daphnia magna]
MRVLAIVLLIAFLIAQVAARDLSKYKPRGVLFPRPPSKNKKPIVPVKHAATINTRGFCGRENTTSSRIVGGTEASPNSLPWQVAFFVDDRFFCGGSLISNEWILTAAHCVEDAGFFDILLGAHNVRLNATEEPHRIEVRSNFSIVHPEWSSVRFKNDVALIKLPQPIKFTPEIQPVCMAPPSEPDHVGDILHVSGWGRSSDCNGCRNLTYPARSRCSGDSGGPLSFINEGVHNQVGIVSFGPAAGCEIGLPAAFSRVSFYAKWISSITGLII